MSDRSYVTIICAQRDADKLARDVLGCDGGEGTEFGGWEPGGGYAPGAGTISEPEINGGGLTLAEDFTEHCPGIPFILIDGGYGPGGYGGSISCGYAGRLNSIAADADENATVRIELETGAPLAKDLQHAVAFARRYRETLDAIGARG